MRMPFTLFILGAALLACAWTAHAEIGINEAGDGPDKEDVSPVQAEAAHPEKSSPSLTAPAKKPGSTPEEPGPQDTATPKTHVHVVTLEEAINRGLEANRGILDAKDRVESARLSIVSAESEFELKLFPDASAGVTGSNSDDEGTEKDLGAGISIQKKLSMGTVLEIHPNVEKNQDGYRSSIDSFLIQPLLRGSSREFNLALVQGTEFGERSSQRALYLTRVNTVVATVRAVYSVVGQREFVRLDAESASRFKGHAEAARVKEKFGLASPIDVYRAEIQMKQAEDSLATAQEAYQDAQDALKLILAFPIEEKIDVVAPLKYSLVRTSEEKAVETALRNRVELKQARDAVADSERRSRVARHGILPDLNVVLSFSPFEESSQFGESLAMDNYTWGISLSGSTDLARTAERAAYQQSLLEVQAAYRELILKRDEVARDAKSALRVLIKAEQRIEIQKQQIKQAEGKLKLAQVKFKHGLANNFDLIEAEEELRSARTNLVSVVIDYIVGTYAFRASMGTLVERPPGL